MDYLKATEKMEKIFGKKLDTLFNLLHKRPSAVLMGKKGNIRVIVYRNHMTLRILKQGKDYILILRIPYRISQKLKLPPTITTSVPEGFIDTSDVFDIIENFLASIRADLTELLR